MAFISNDCILEKHHRHDRENVLCTETLSMAFISNHCILKKNHLKVVKMFFVCNMSFMSQLTQLISLESPQQEEKIQKVKYFGWLWTENR